MSASVTSPRRGVCLCGLALLMMAGCSSHVDRLRPIRYAYFRGDLGEASKLIDTELERGGREANVFRLEQSIVKLASGDPHGAEQSLRGVRDSFDHLEQSDAGEFALSLLTDDTHQAYAGEDYEKVLIRCMLALSNLMADGGDAEAYSLQIADKQRQIVEAGADPTGKNPKLDYKQVALGPYISGLLREETHTNFDDVARSYAKVVSWRPEFSRGRDDLLRAQNGHHSRRGNGVVYVFTLVGRGPCKEEVIEAPSSVALILATEILRSTSQKRLPPSIAPIKVPKVVLSPNRVDNVRVLVDGLPAGATETITDVGQMAVQQSEAVFPRVVAKAVVRRLVKKSAVYTAKEAFVGEDNSLGSFLFDLGGIVWEATEAADTRCWGLLPDKIQVLRLELPAGEHQIALQPALGFVSVGPPRPVTVHVADGRNAYVLANFPTEQLVGKILTK